MNTRQSFTALVITAFSSATMAAGDYEQCMAQFKNNPDTVPDLEESQRDLSLFDYAFMRGYADRIKQRNQYLSQDDGMDFMFDFSKLLLPPAKPNGTKLLPPVIEASSCEHPKAVNLSTGKEKSCYIFHPVSGDKKKYGVELSWRDYLIITENTYTLKQALGQFKKINPEYEGNKSQDKSSGFCYGLSYANQEFKQNIDALLKDYYGMRLYLTLLKSGKIKPQGGEAKQ